MKKHTSILLAIFALALISIVFVKIAYDKNNSSPVALAAAAEPVSSGISIHERNLPTAHSTASAAPHVEKSSSSSKPPKSSLISLYNNKKSGRAFVFEAWQHPEAGGRFYASKVVEFCSGASSTLSLMKISTPISGLNDTPEITHARNRSLRKVQLLCEDFTAFDFSEQGLLALLREQGKDDALLKKQRTFLASRSNGSPLDKTALAEIIATQDPLLIDDTGLALFIYRDPDNALNSIYFEGTSYPLASSPEVFAAVYMLPCELGLRCDIDGDSQLAVACASGGGCHETRSARAYTEILQSDEKRFQSALSLTGRMAEAIRSNNIEAFVRK